MTSMLRPLFTLVSLAGIVSFALAETSNEILLESQHVRRDAGATCCIPLLKHIQYEEGVDTSPLPTSEWDCQLLRTSATANGKSGKISKLEDLENLNIQLEATDSGSSLLCVTGAMVPGKGRLKIPPGAQATIERRNQGKNLRGRSEENLFEHGKRMLLQGNKKVLAIHVTDSNGTSTTPTVTELSDEIFGTNTDVHNLASQYKACSHDKLQFSPITSSDLQGVDANTPGVYAVTIPISSTSDSVIREAITDQLNQEWGSTLLPQPSPSLPNESPFDYVMYCIPPGTGGWIAYGYTNSWLTVYNNHWCTKLSTQMHELGHNLNLAHSGRDDGIDTVYGDRSGMMGYSYNEDDGPVMCFNAAKSWQLGWYSDKGVTVDPSVAPWSGRLVGIADYDPDPLADNVLVKIETNQAKDYYVNFNRATGINFGTVEGADQVILSFQEPGYSPSKRMRILTTGETHYISNFGGTGDPVRVTVNDINLSANPAYADITVAVGCDTDAECLSGYQYSVDLACAGEYFCNSATNRCEFSQPANGCNCDMICDASENADNCPSDCGPSVDLDTTVSGFSTYYGNMFKIEAMNRIQITGFEINANVQGSPSNAFVYTRSGPYEGFEKEPNSWMLVQSDIVTSAEAGSLTPLSPLPDPIIVEAGTTQSFYIFLDTSDMKYQVGSGEFGEEYVSDANLRILKGSLNAKSFQNFNSDLPFVWNGRVKYVVAPLTGSPPNPTPQSSTPNPTPAPTPQPTTPDPTPAPTPDPTPQPTTPEPTASFCSNYGNRNTCHSQENPDGSRQCQWNQSQRECLPTAPPAPTPQQTTPTPPAPTPQQTTPTPPAPTPNSPLPCNNYPNKSQCVSQQNPDGSRRCQWRKNRNKCVDK